MKAVSWMAIYPKVIVLTYFTWYWCLVLGIVLRWGFISSKVIVLTQCASARHRALGNGRRLLSFSRFIIRSNVNSEIFWPGWRGNRKQSKSWIGTTTHQNFMIILIDAHLQRENLLTFWCVVYYDEDQLLCTTMKVKDQLLRFTMKMKDQLLWITMKFYQGRSKYCPEWTSLLALESSRGPKWVKDPGNGLKSIRGTFFRRR